RLFKTFGLRWVPTRKIFTDSTTKVNSEPPNGSNDDITNQYECDQTLNVSAGTLNLSAGLALQRQMMSVHISSGLALQQQMINGQTDPVHSSSGPAPNLLTPGPISLGLAPNPAPAIPYVPPTNKEMEILFQPKFDEYFEHPPATRLVPPDPVAQVPIAQVPVNQTGPSVSISVNTDAPLEIYSSSSLDHQSSSVHHDVIAEQTFEVNPLAVAHPEPFVNVFALDSNSEASSFGVITTTETNQSSLPHDYLRKWTASHLIDNIIRNPSRPVSTRKQLATDALWCFYNSVLSKVEPKNFSYAVTE
ncbi:hypothetical protein Tco_1518565, partial [Tanacetum coccineum]